MHQATPNKIVSFVWRIADDVPRDLFRWVRCAPDDWVGSDSTENGHEGCFIRHVYWLQQPSRALAKIGADIRTFEIEAEGFLGSYPAKAEA